MKATPRSRLALETSSVKDFRLRNRDLVEATEQLLQCELLIANAFLAAEQYFSPAAVAIIQQIHEYRRESFFNSMRNQGNIGLALTRLACELGRDTILLIGDRSLETAWWEREGSMKAEYKKYFRFDCINSVFSGKLYDLYKMSSRFGVHGHVSFAESVAETAEINSSNYAIMKPDRKQSIKCFWINIISSHSFILAMLEHNRNMIVEKFQPSDVKVISSIVDAALAMDVDALRKA